MVSDGGSFGKPFYWPEPVRRAMMNRDVLATGIEILNANLGVRIVPAGDDKSPIKSLCPHWSTDATDDPQTLRQWSAVWPDVRWGIIPGENFLVVDDDTGELDTHALGIESTWAERTRRGTHYWCRIAPGLLESSKTYLSDKRGEITTGSAGYVVASPADPYVPIDVDTPFVGITATSPVLELVRPQRTIAPIAIPNLTEQHHREARIIASALCQAPDQYGRDMKALLEGNIPAGASASEADYRLALGASYWTSDPAVIVAVLLASNLPREKWRRPDYLPRTIAKALDRRAILTEQSQNIPYHSRITEHIDTGHGLLPTPLPTTVRYGTPPVGSVSREVLIGNILAFAVSVREEDSEDEWGLSDGWVRVPVNEFATLHHVDRKTVQRAVEDAMRRGLIESQVVRKPQGGRVICHRLIRLVRADVISMSLSKPITLVEGKEAA